MADPIQRPHQFIFINGPRRSGKDTASNFIAAEWIAVRQRKFASSMKRALKEFFGISDDLYKQLEATGANDLKLQTLTELFGMSWVGALIWFSEEVMKPKFGAGVFGKVALTELQQRTTNIVTVFSDCGFAAELMPIIKHYGAANCHVFQLFRDFYGFTGDSRGYIAVTDLPASVSFHAIKNNYELYMFKRQVLIRTNKILGQERRYD